MHLDSPRSSFDKTRDYQDGSRLAAYARLSRRSGNTIGVKEMALIRRAREEPSPRLRRSDAG